MQKNCHARCKQKQRKLHNKRLRTRRLAEKIRDRQIAGKKSDRHSTPGKTVYGDASKQAIHVADLWPKGDGNGWGGMFCWQRPSTFNQRQRRKRNRQRPVPIRRLKQNAR